MMQEPTFCRDFARDCTTLISGQQYEQDTQTTQKEAVVVPRSTNISCALQVLHRKI